MASAKQSEIKTATSNAMLILDTLRDNSTVQEGVYLELANALKTIYDKNETVPRGVSVDGRAMLMGMMVYDPNAVRAVTESVSELFEKTKTHGPFTTGFITELLTKRLEFRNQTQKELKVWLTDLVKSYMTWHRLSHGNNDIDPFHENEELNYMHYRLYSNARVLVYKLLAAAKHCGASRPSIDDLEAKEKTGYIILKAITETLDAHKIRPDALFPRFFAFLRSADITIHGKVSLQEYVNSIAVQDSRRTLFDVVLMEPEFALWIVKRMENDQYYKRQLSFSEMTLCKDILFDNIFNVHRHLNFTLELNDRLLPYANKYDEETAQYYTMSCVDGSCIGGLRVRLHFSSTPWMDDASEKTQVFYYWKKDGVCRQESLDGDWRYGALVSDEEDSTYCNQLTLFRRTGEETDHVLIQASNTMYVTMGDFVDALCRLEEKHQLKLHAAMGRVLGSTPVTSVFRRMTLCNTDEDSDAFDVHFDIEPDVRVNRKRDRCAF